MAGRRAVLSVDEYVQGVVSNDRAVLARAMTLAESKRPEHRALAEEVMTRLLPRTGGAYRVGVSGAPGVGKSTFLERLGLDLIAAGHRPCILAIDPSSVISGGSVLGDKTRMNRLAQRPEAFIRPTPSGNKLGGVSAHTREMLLLAEAAGYDVVLIETVGVGQSELSVSAMVDFFLVLMLPAGGDDLQGIKRGILEVADLIAVNKADGDLEERAMQAEANYASVLRLLAPKGRTWGPKTLSVSGLTGRGMSELWAMIEDHRRAWESAGGLGERRSAQQKAWMWSLIEDELWSAFREHPAVKGQLSALEAAVEAGTVMPSAAARALVAAFLL
ncbi:MAG: methylmalonyl Co-A mutase-associated GTPase MeaB [Myxococcota bacterium]